MLGGPPADDGSDEQNAMLRRLAKALDIAPTAFFDVSDYDLSQTNELLHLWHGITDRADRAKVLAIVRSIASRA